VLGVKAKPADAGRYARLDPCARVGPSAAMSFADRPGLAAGPRSAKLMVTSRLLQGGSIWTPIPGQFRRRLILSALKVRSKIDEATINPTGSITTCGNTTSHPDCRARIDRAVRDGRLPVLRIGRQIRFSADAVESPLTPLLPRAGR